MIIVSSLSAISSNSEFYFVYGILPNLSVSKGKNWVLRSNKIFTFVKGKDTPKYARERNINFEEVEDYSVCRKADADLTLFTMDETVK